MLVFVEEEVMKELKDNRSLYLNHEEVRLLLLAKDAISKFVNLRCMSIQSEIGT